ncbi:UNVERIFIED_CONTAM: hypothetical protein PYX00_005708 [Menopon gallinae]|uniref:Uncharacterized protein n=1 Tax=Menopon gallinae TaxID=328185 RepID=A0AAW2HUB8_9NEOP
MMLRVFVALFLFATGVYCFDVPRRVIDDRQDRHLGYFLKSVEDLERPKENEVFRRPGRIEGRTKERPKSVCSDVVEPLDLVVKYVEEERSNRSCNESSKTDDDVPVPLHVTNTAREQCLEGYAADENGVCQKTMQPKGDKRLSLRRRKRAEQTAPKLSYADVVKYGKNPPKHLLTTTVKAVVLTTTPRPVEVKKVATTPRSVVTTQPPVAKTTIKAAVPVKTGVGPVAVTTAKPAVSPAVKPVVPPVRAETVKPVTPAVVPKPTTAKSPSRGSAVGDINQAFLSGEKSSVVAQSLDGKVKPVVVPIAEKKTVDVTRLRRSLGLN